jgi:hypothetical protein
MGAVTDYEPVIGQRGLPGEQAGDSCHQLRRHIPGTSDLIRRRIHCCAVDGVPDVMVQRLVHLKSVISTIRIASPWGAEVPDELKAGCG